MSQDPEPQIAIFLGPSLRREIAETLLLGRYFPPAQFGDFYRLMGTGVEAILLLDGVFHGRAAVWQREILYAMQHGVRVYGASSMGALRAAELHAHGMVGLGEIFRQYVSGEIDGDDEVALLHADAEQGYRPLTQPLVNTRFHLARAAEKGILGAEQAAAILLHLKQLPFWERSAEALREAPALQDLDPNQQEGLRAFLSGSVDLKGQDAELALKEVARREQQVAGAAGLQAGGVSRHGTSRMAATSETPVGSGSPAGPSLPSHHDRFQLLKRSFPRAHGEPLEGQALADFALSDPNRRRLFRWALSARFFAWQWAVKNGHAVPQAETFRAPSPSLHDLRQNALTESEYDALASRNAALKSLFARSPAEFGLPSVLQDTALLSVLPDMQEEALRNVASRQTIATALPYVAAWCQLVGAAPPAETIAILKGRWHGALSYLTAHNQSASFEPFLQAVWALDKGPVYFGYTLWSLPAELLRELQISGATAAIAAQYEAKAP